VQVVGARLRMRRVLKDMLSGARGSLQFQDEMRVGQKNGLVYQWAKKGTRPRRPKDQALCQRLCSD
jgi:hypothetical protein